MRPDLGLAFPQPAGRDFPRFREWAESRWYVDGESALVRSGAGAMRPAWSDVSRVPGINLIGYHSYAKSIGDVVRLIGHALDAAGVAPRRDRLPPIGQSPFRDATADDDRRLVRHEPLPRRQRRPVPESRGRLRGSAARRTPHDRLLVLGGRRIPDSFREAIGLVDEIWAGSDFVADAFRAITDTPVRVVPVPVSEPDVPELAREYFGLPDDRFVFLVTFDYLSVAERKNPIGAIEAFRSAFPEQRPDGPMLVVKSLNADRRPQHHERAVIAAAGREDIVLIDRHATRGEQMALTRMADCLVSLHRSCRGAGLHLMEAIPDGDDRDSVLGQPPVLYR
ncbi:MAG: hypothetical protein R2697_07900 [Ilumatobacteraceae bacterium]